QKWQTDWDQFNQDSANSVRRAEVEQQRINHLENIVDRGLARKATLSKELESLATDPETEQLATIESNLGQLSTQQGDLEKQSANLNARIEETRQQLKAANEQLSQERNRLQTLLGRQASLEALQQQALGSKDKDRQKFIENAQLSGRPRIVDSLKVASGWEKAVETVLGEHLQAFRIEDVASLSDALKDFTNGQITIHDSQFKGGNAAGNSALAGRELAGRLTAGVETVSSIAANIYVADSLAEALGLRSQLRAGESIVTR